MLFFYYAYCENIFHLGLDFLFADFTYDDYGNNTSVSITEKAENEVKKTITSTATYTSDHNHMATATDALGNVTTYGYNLQTGLLDWVQYPEDTEATRTEYTYDEMYREATITADLYNGTTDTHLDMSVEYAYADDLLTAITTPTTTYSFGYGDFSLRESVSVGTRTLAEYTYESGTNRLERLDYGNGDNVEYTYDGQGRKICETYEDNETVSYAYDNSGNLATVTDSETGTVTTYYYDLLNRNVGYREKGTNLDHSVTYIYDAENNLSSMTEVINGVSKTYSYTYNEDNRLTSMTVDGVTVEYTYDTFGRLSQQVTKQGDTTILTEQTGYQDTDTTASNQVVSYNGYTYTYDDNGNILSVSDGTNTTTYVYDSQNQLIRENNQARNYTHTWTYDNAGNIQSRTEYDYTTAEDLSTLTPNDTVSYEYNDDKGWGDLLTSYDGRTITYDGIGNPLNDGEWTYSWKNGRQLESMSKDGTTWTYTYNADGLRTKRTNGTDTYTYVYSGSQLAMMSKGNDTLHFTYDASGVPLAVKYNGTTYYYKTNLQGDIIAILDSTGTAVVTYEYDAWGVLLDISGTMKDTLGTINPLTYRGYVYDHETGLYYLQSRYYNPEWGRFINADGLVSMGQELLGNNASAYSQGNPVAYSDHSGAIRTYCVGLTDSGKTNGKYKVDNVLPFMYPSSEWYTATDDQKKQMLYEYHNILSKAMNINTEIAFYYKAPEDRILNTGSYQRQTNTVKINLYVLSTNNSYRLFSTIAHELRHAYQYQTVEKMHTTGYPRKGSVEYQTVMIWDYNLRNYISLKPDYDAYLGQPVEVDARKFANQGV